MYITPEIIELIKRYEGFRARKYICPAGYPTIGYGHVLKTGEKLDIISQTQAHELLLKDIALAAKSVQQNISVPLNPNQFSALVSFVFNLGGGALQRSTMRQKINRGEHSLVPPEFSRWVYAGGHKLPGLVKRRADEARIYRSL